MSLLRWIAVWLIIFVDIAAYVFVSAVPFRVVKFVLCCCAWITGKMSLLRVPKCRDSSVRRHLLKPAGWSCSMPMVGQVCVNWGPFTWWSIYSVERTSLMVDDDNNSLSVHRCLLITVMEDGHLSCTCGRPRWNYNSIKILLKVWDLYFYGISVGFGDFNLPLFCVCFQAATSNGNFLINKIFERRLGFSIVIGKSWKTWREE